MLNGKQKELIKMALAGIQLGQKMASQIAKNSGQKSPTELLIDKYQTTHLSWQLLKESVTEFVRVKSLNPQAPVAAWVDDILASLPQLAHYSEQQWQELRVEVVLYPNF